MYDIAREDRMMIRKNRHCKRVITSLAVTMIISGCAPASAPIQGESPLKATIQPSGTPARATATKFQGPSVTVALETCEETRGRLVEESYTLLDGQSEADVIVYLPPCYDDSDEDYPVAYFLHGYPQDQGHWIELGVIDSYEALLAGSRIGPIVLIFPYQPEPYFTQTDGGPSSMEELLLEQLSTEMSQRYQISQHPSERAILGVSRGGVWALEISMRHPETFDVVAALSPALAYNHPRRAYDPFEIARSTDDLPGHIFISAGDREPQFANEIDRFADTLERSGISFQYLQHEGRHENSAWGAILERVMIFLGNAISK